MSLWLDSIGFSPSRSAVVILAVAMLAMLDLTARSRGSNSHLFFGAALGTALSFGLMQASRALLSPLGPNPFLLGMGVLGVMILWRMLFGNWDPKTKATVLGTFVFWVAFRILASEAPDQRIAHLLAIAVALIPAIVWCALFLPYHRERLSVVFCMFFAGMLSTIPILFYDALLRRGVALHFFLFRLVPESFSTSSQQFVASQWPELGQTPSAIAAMFLSFLFVGLIEEGSKLWVLHRGGRQFTTSVDDMLQFAVLVAIGFAFAENVTHSGYFLGFVRQYLLVPNPDWGAFLGNVAGRSILTSMVHIVSTGILGYFAGLALFAGPFLQESQSRPVHRGLTEYLHQIFGIERRRIFRREMLLVGFFFAVLLHAISNFLVSLPDALPGNPHTLGALLDAGKSSPLHWVPLLLFPTFLYVVGGFFVLSSLFMRKESMKERGQLVEVETFVTVEK